MASAIPYVKPCGTFTRRFSWQFFRASVGFTPGPTMAVNSLNVTVKAFLSGETATAVVPSGQPEPLTVTTLMVISPGGGTGIGIGVVVGGGANGAVRSAATVLSI